MTDFLMHTSKLNKSYVAFFYFHLCSKCLFYEELLADGESKVISMLLAFLKSISRSP